MSEQPLGETGRGRDDPGLAGAGHDPRLAAANNEFAFRLFRELAGQDGSKNLSFSPFSIAPWRWQ